ncbi:UNVERIFIED_CONTAM: hypothetical protein RMT77_008927 [Armadillidium vulgare]
MSDIDSDKDQQHVFLPTDMLLAIGNPDPLGLPLFRHERTEEEHERASLMGSQLFYSSGSGYSDELPDTSLLRGTVSYGAVRKVDEGITLTWRDLSVYVPQKKPWWKNNYNHKPFKRVLNNVSGAVLPGTLVAMMGSSGAGKSTLMNALAHRTSSGVVVDGDIFVNGHRANSGVSRMAGYVYQDDLFVGSLTVREHLSFMARMKMDNRLSSYDRKQRVNELLKELGLMKAQNTRIGVPGMEKCISGGERKRLAFASEILTDPPLLFCDEPTTGLDSYNAKKLVKMMKEMAARRKTILCTIHQPSSEVFAMFDRLLLLAEGRIAFLGSSKEALEFFDSLNHKCPPTFNPADFYIHTLAVLPGHEVRSRDRIKRICNNFAVSTYAKDIEITIQHQENMATSRMDSNIEKEPYASEMPIKPLWIVELYWLLWRSLLDSYRNPAMHSVRILQKIMMAVTVGVCYTNVKLNQAGIQDIEGVIFIFITENTFPSLYGVLNIFPHELPVFLREYKNGVYGCDTYYISKMVSLIPGFIVDPIAFCLICYWMVGLQQYAYQFFMTILIVIFTANVSSACGAMFSAIFESIPYIMLFLIPFDVVLLISGGLFINLQTLPPWISWVRYLSWFMYSNEALTVTQWTGVTNITCEFEEGIPCISTGDQVIEEYSFSPKHLPMDFAFMISLYAIFHIIGYIGLRVRAKKK